MRAIAFKNKNLSLTEPFKSLFTQGMVCHETYKDKNNNWLSPDEIETKDGKLSAQWEHTIVVLTDGIEILTDRDF